jgi:nitric oxide dioxygenase
MNATSTGLVSKSWATLTAAASAQQIGMLLFHKLFVLDPRLTSLFNFATELTAADLQDGGATAPLEAMFSSPAFTDHCRSVVDAVSLAVGLLESDVGQLVQILEELGARHVEYGVADGDYATLLDAFLFTLSSGLGGLNADLRVAWTDCLTLITKTMVTGANDARARGVNKGGERLK